LLIKHRDAHISTEDVTIEQPRSAVSGLLLAEIAEAGGGDVAKAATGDPNVAVKAPAKARAKKKKAAAGSK
jgi:hypothetical protein